MASVNTNSTGWMINFIKEQDLTSNYMNKLLLGCLHPGVYNSNIAVSQTTKDKVISWTIFFKKGTTLIFSNDYIGGNDNITPCKRNFNNTNLSSWEKNTSSENGHVIIKYTAEYDCSYSIDMDTSENTSQDLFLFLKVDSAIDDSQDITPLIAKINTDEGYDNTYKVITKDTDSSYIIPDGCKNYNSSLESYCFLCIGIIRELSESDTELGNFTFTSQNLPEYGYSPIMNSNCEYPSLVFIRDNLENMNFKGVDFRDILINNTLCNQFGTSDVSSGDTTWISMIYNSQKSESFTAIDIASGWSAVYGYINKKINYGVVNLDKLITSTPNIVTATEWGVISEATIVPLDSCEYNVSRLLSCIQNVDIWSYVIGELHKSADANEINDIFPVALIHKNEGEDFVNPNNVLSYFDLYYKSSSINIYNGSMNNIFHVIPILEDSSDTTISDSTSDTTTE